MSYPKYQEPTEAELLAAFSAIPAARAAPVTRAAPTPRGPYGPLAEAVRIALRKRDAEIAALKADMVAMRNEIAVAKKLDEVGARLDRIEQSRGLRSVV